MNLKTLKIFLILTLTLLSFSNVNAYDPNETDSMYKYNALENNIIFQHIAKIEKTAEQYSIEALEVDAVLEELEQIKERPNFSMEKLDDAMYDVNNSNGVKSFLIGENLGTLKFELVQIKDAATLLNTFILESIDMGNKNEMNKELKTLKEKQLVVEQLIAEKDNKFSLFGWLITIL